MPDPIPNPGLLPSLGRLVRGLSALFWGLPLALIVCVGTARAEWLRAFTVFPPLAATGLLLYGLWQLGSFQKQERPWRSALDRARLFALTNFGLSPFLYWWNRVPDHPFFGLTVYLLALSALLFLSSLSPVLQRLGAMLPDETLRLEIQRYTVLNTLLLSATLAFGILLVTFVWFLPMPPALASYLLLIEKGDRWLFAALALLPLAIFVLLPLAVTMALIWKTKEVILDNVFSAK